MSSFGSRHRVILAMLTAVIVLAGAAGGVALTMLHHTSLTILIKDVPSRAQASVLVSGPGGFSKHLSSSRSFTVPAGTYRVEAEPEPDGSSMVYPTREITNIAVSPGSSRQVVVDYADIVPATTKIGTAATLNGATVTSNSIMVPSSNVGISSLAVGDVVAFGQTPETPKGLLVRIIAIATNNGMTTLTVAPAPITAALTRAKIDIVARFNPTLATGLAYSPGAAPTAFMSDQLGGPIVTTALSKTALVKLSWSPRLPAYSLATGQGSSLCSGSQPPGATATVDPTASVALGLTATIAGSWGFASGPQFRLVIIGDESALAGLQADLTGSCRDSVTQTLFDLPPVDVQIGPIPLVVVPEVQLTASFDANLNGAVAVGAKQTITVEGGVSYANGKFHLIHHFSSSAGLVGKSGSSATLKVSGGPVLLLALDDQEAGPNVQVLGYVKSTASTTNPRANGIYSGGIAGIGAEVHFFGINASAGPYGVTWGPVKLWPRISSGRTVTKPSPSEYPHVLRKPHFASLDWSSPQSIDPGHAILSISCTSASFCAAVDNAGNALIWNGASWYAPQSIDQLANGGLTSNALMSVSCASASFCMAVDNFGNALTWNGASWYAPQSIDQLANGGLTSNALTSVSCPSASFCMAVDNFGNALTWNGSSWSSPQSIDPNSSLSVSCASASFCAAVDDDGHALIWNGSIWSSPARIDPGVGFVSVSCPTASFCVAIDLYGKVLTWNGSSWSSPQSIDPYHDSLLAGGYLGSVSCPTVSFCIAVGAFGHINIWNGSVWSTPLSISSSGSLDSVSCPTASFCAAVDNLEHIITGRGA